MKNNVQEPIKDTDIKPFFDRNKQMIDVDEQRTQLQEQKLFDQELERVILKDPKGAELQKLVEMGYLNLQEDVIAEYIGEKGREYKNGVITIDKDVLNKIHLKCLASVSKQLGADRALNVKDIEQIASKEDHIERTQYIENEVHSNERKSEPDKKTINQTLNTDIKLNNEDINNICKELGIAEKKYLNKEETQKMLNSLGLNSNIEKYEKETVNTYMTLYDSNILEFLAQANILKNNSNKEELDKFVEDSEFGIGVNFESKYYKEIINEDGKIDIEKGLKFWKDYKIRREYAILNKDIDGYITSSKKPEKTLALLLLRGTTIDDVDTQKKLKKIADSKDVFDKDGNFDKEKIYNYVRSKIIGCDVEEVLNDNIFTNDKTALQIIQRIRDRELEKIEQKRKVNGENVINDEKEYTMEGVQQKREQESKRKERICSKKEKIVYDVINSLNAGNTNKMKNFFENPENAKQVVFLYCQFRKKELGRNITSKDVNTAKDSDTSAIIAKYMMENSEYFHNYFQEIGQLKPELIAEMANSQSFSLSTNQATRVIHMYDAINLGTRAISNTEKKYSEKIDEINDLLESGNDQEKIYELVKKIPTSAFSTEMLEVLKDKNEQKFADTFKNKEVTRAVGKDTIGAIYFSAIRLFTKGIYTLPRMIIDKETREEYVPKIKNHIKNGAKRLSNVLTTNKNNEDNFLGKFIKSFRGEKNRRLPSGNEENDIEGKLENSKSQEQNEGKTVQGNSLDYIKVDYLNGSVDVKQMAERKKDKDSMEMENSEGR